MEIADIETLKCLFLYMGYNRDTKEWCEYEISKYRNDLYALVKHLLDGGVGYLVTFNGLGFDGQVLQYILNNYTRWWNLGNLEVVSLIYRFAQKLIDDQKYDLWLPFREEELTNKHLDLFKIHHYDNENRRTSLKWLEFTMDAPNVEEMPIHHSVEELSPEEIQLIKDYCRNDIENTHTFYLHTIGEVEHEVYKGVNMIQDRLDIIQEMKLSPKAVNYSNVKIGEEINKKMYLDNTGLTEKALYDLKKNRKSTAGFTYGQCIPDYVEFKTPAFQEFHKRMKKVKVNLNEKEEYPFSYNGTHYMIAKGGIHSNESYRIVIPPPGWILRDADIGSQYPHSIIKRLLYPSHLSSIWLKGYTAIRDKRLECKPLAKKDRKYKGVVEMLKYSLNGGGFGKTNERSNWQYDPFVHFRCTIGNQFEILMLIESLEMAGIHVISANTDGIVCLFPQELNNKYYEVCNWWEEKVGNNIQGKLEFTDYQKIIQTSVNDYLAIKVDGEIKKKGDFCTAMELHKNPSRRIIAIALEKYFVEGIPVAETIKNHQRIYDFCIGVKASKDYHYETVDKNGKVETFSRLVRYYVSTGGTKLYKVKNDGSEADGVQRSQCEAGSWKCTVANKIDQTKDIENYEIDYGYYIQKSEERIKSIESGRKIKGINDNPNQTTLF